MFRIVICFTPFMVCLFWLILFSINYRRLDPAKKMLTWFLLTCTSLYFCHALFFTEGLSAAMECVWALCSLWVYPIYYLYIRTLTSDSTFKPINLSVLVPSVIVVIYMAVKPGKIADMIRMILFAIQVVLVCRAGIRMLQSFNREISSYYANVEGRQATDVRNLLIAFVFTSCISAAVNAIGKANVAVQDLLLFPLAVLFSGMLFSLSYIGYTRQFSIKDLHESQEEDIPEPAGEGSNELLGCKLDKLMDEKKLFLEKNLKINDVAAQIGSCRTYLSNYLNQIRGETFSEYINKLRIEYAKTLLQDNPEGKMVAIADKLGFSNEQSFYRNFKKYTGMTPTQWKNKHSDSF